MLSFLIHILSQQQKIKDSLLTWFKTKKILPNTIKFFRNSVIFDNIFLCKCKTRKLN